jgi:hypothetical protein
MIAPRFKYAIRCLDETENFNQFLVWNDPKISWVRNIARATKFDNQTAALNAGGLCAATSWELYPFIHYSDDHEHH